MRVARLISILKKMPKTAEVFTSAHDNSEWETAGYTSMVNLYNKEELRVKHDLDSKLGGYELESFEGQPKQWVTISS